MNKWILYAMLTVLVMGLAGCGGEEGESSATGDGSAHIVGVVASPGGAGTAVRIASTGQEDVTSGDGFFSLLDVAPGTHTLHFSSAAGAGAVNVNVPANSTVFLRNVQVQGTSVSVGQSDIIGGDGALAGPANVSAAGTPAASSAPAVSTAATTAPGASSAPASSSASSGGDLLAGVGWKYDGAAVTCSMSGARRSGGSLSWSDNRPGNWPAQGSPVVNGIICLGVIRGGGVAMGPSKFDWVRPGQRSKGIENITGNYMGWQPAPGDTCFLVLVSVDGKERSTASNTFTW